MHPFFWDAPGVDGFHVRRYFVRSGLVRKDRLCSFVPSGFHPATVVVRNFTELLQGLAQLGSSQLEVASKKAVVKYDPWSHFVFFLDLRISEVVMDEVFRTRKPTDFIFWTLLLSAYSQGTVVFLSSSLPRSSEIRCPSQLWGGVSSSPKKVLKKAQSSNAYGIRFLTDAEAAQLLRIHQRRRRANWCLRIGL